MLTLFFQPSLLLGEVAEPFKMAMVLAWLEALAAARLTDHLVPLVLEGMGLLAKVLEAAIIHLQIMQ